MTPDNSIDAGQRADNPHGDQSGVPVDERTIVLWVPDFPLYAARCDNEVPEGPLALVDQHGVYVCCLLYTSPSPRDVEESRMPSSA